MPNNTEKRLVVSATVRSTRVALSGVAVLAVWALTTQQQHAIRLPGVIVPGEPSQYGTTLAPWKAGGCEFKPLAELRVRARVLSTERYWFGRTAAISPVDLALGWGEMSDQRILDHLSITHGGRWYSFRAKHALPAAVEVLQSKSANMHMIPATESARELLLSIHAGDVVRFAGTLVEISWPDGARWRSSLKRTDTGEGSCELVWVRDLTVEQ